MKKIVLVFFLVFFLVILSGCSSSFENSVKCVYYNQVPFTNSVAREHFYEYKKIEKDDYGKTLVFCEMPGVSAIDDFFGNNSEISFYMILQDYDSKSVTVYDNDCYWFSANGENIDETELNSFKEINDWNQPTDEDKSIKYMFSKKYIKDSDDDYAFSYLEEQEVLRLLEENYQITDVCVDGLISTKNKRFYIMRHYICEDQEQFVYRWENACLFTIQNDSMTNIRELEGTANDWKDQIRDYKIFLDSQEQTDVDSASGE